MTPETEATSHYHFAHTRNFALDIDGLDEKTLQGVVNAFHEDQDMIEAQQKTIDLDPAAPMLPLEVDKALIYFRREVDRIVTSEQLVSAAAE